MCTEDSTKSNAKCFGIGIGYATETNSHCEILKWGLFLPNTFLFFHSLIVLYNFWFACIGVAFAMEGDFGHTKIVTINKRILASN